eukprot:TRINITY_DN2707_c0_g1_i1.p2 TRINITY_DN2707_c0_g1~~TRINITY_DN2707_c0_g1_i1.p2  ORF type:complete len:664 (+),score=191.80 TRINITY_DN2707_c0_g1_i1:33-1994(+)
MQVTAVCAGDPSGEGAGEGEAIAVADSCGFVRLVSVAAATFRLFAVCCPGALPWNEAMLGDAAPLAAVGAAQATYVSALSFVPGIPRCLVFALSGSPRVLHSGWYEDDADRPEPCQVFELGRHDREVTALAVGEAGAVVATGDAGGSLHLWSAAALLSGRAVDPRAAAPQLHKAAVTAVCVLDEGTAAARVASGSSDGYVHLLCAASGAVLYSLTCGLGAVASLAPFSCGIAAEAGGLAAGGEQGLMVFGAGADGSDPVLLYSLPSSGAAADAVTAVSRHPPSDTTGLCATGTARGEVTMLCRRTLRGLTVYSLHCPVRFCAVVAGGGGTPTVAVVGATGALWLWPAAAVAHDAASRSSGRCPEESPPEGGQQDSPATLDTTIDEDFDEGEGGARDQSERTPTPEPSPPRAAEATPRRSPAEQQSPWRTMSPGEATSPSAASPVHADPDPDPESTQRSASRRRQRQREREPIPAPPLRDLRKVAAALEDEPSEAMRGPLGRPKGRRAAAVRERLRAVETEEFDAEAYAATHPGLTKRAQLRAPMADVTTYGAAQRRYQAPLPAVPDPPDELAGVGALTQTVERAVDHKWLAGREEDPSLEPLPDLIAALLPRSGWQGETYDCPASLCKLPSPRRPFPAVAFTEYYAPWHSALL